MLNDFRKYMSLLDDLIVSLLVDIKSLRYQLIIWAYILNGFVLYLVYLGKADYKLAGVCIVLLTAVYGMFFQSKRHQSEMEANQPAEDDEPSVERDPEI